MKVDFPVIKDVENALTSDGLGTIGGMKTIEAPGYALAVTNPTDETQTGGAVIVSTK